MVVTMSRGPRNKRPHDAKLTMYIFVAAFLVEEAFGKFFFSLNLKERAFTVIFIELLFL